MPMGLTLSSDLFNYHMDSSFSKKKELTNIIKDVDDIFLYGKLMDDLLIQVWAF